MKKVLLFALLLGAGLLVLRLVESRMSGPDGLVPQTEQGEGPGPPTPSGTKGADETQEGGVPQEGPDEPGPGPRNGEDPIGLVLSGAFSTTLYDSESGRAVLRIESEDSATQGDRDILLSVEAEILDPSQERAEPQALVEARRVGVLRVGMTEDLGPRHENRLSLEEVEAVVRSGVPLVPLRFSSSSAVIDVVDETSRRLSTDDPVTLDSPRLEAQGSGLDVFFDQDMLVLRENGVVRFQEAGELVAELTSKGTTRIFGDVEDVESVLSIEASEQARLEFLGDRPSVLLANVIRIRGRSRAQEGDELGIDGLEAEGGFVWTADKDVFQGQRVVVEMTETGLLREASLTGLPSLRLRLPDPESIVPDAPEGEPVSLRVSDEESIIITWEGAARNFRTRGPSTVEVEGFSLRANGGIDGTEDPAAGISGFTATGGAVLESGFGTLETGELRVRFSTDEEGRRVLQADARIGPRLTGQLEDGRDFSFTSPEELKVERIGERWRIVGASSVVVTVEGEGGFSARADRVEDFDPDSISFLATGNVSFDSEKGRSTGDRLTVHSSTHYEMEGTADRKTLYVGSDGRAEARWAERRGARIRARGDVDASIFAVPGEEGPESTGRYDFRCDEITVDRIEEAPDPADGVLRRTLRLDAVGNVSAVVTTKDDVTDISGGSIGVLRFEFLDELDGEPTRVRSILRAEDDVVALVDTGDAQIDVSSNVLVVEQDRTAEAELRSGTAEGDVRFETTLTSGRTELANLEEPLRLSGEGETLTWNQTGEGWLVPRPGERVRVEGVLPSHGAPFELEADRFRFQSGGDLFADRPEINITELLSAEDGAQRVVTATATSLEAHATSVELIGSVHIQATAGTGSSWLLETERVRFDGSAEEGAQGLPLTGLEAEGGISFVLGSEDDPDDPWIATATGESLRGSSLGGALRLSGSPALIESAVFATEADWLEFDPALRIIVATGAGRFFPSDANQPFWSIDYQSSKTLIEPEALVLVLQEPIYTQAAQNAELRSSWATFWIDRRRWMELPTRSFSEDDPAAEDVEVEPAEVSRARLFNLFESTSLAGLLRETYFEGPVEILYFGELVARADAIFLDVVVGHGWLANATVTIRGDLVGQDFDKLIVKTDWLRHSSDGSLRANKATVAPCDFDNPHIKVVTGDLRLTPVSGSSNRPEYEVELRDNRIELYDKLRLPLPPFHYSADERGRPLWETLRLGDSARFGSFVSAGFVRPAGSVGKSVNKLLGGSPLDYDANYRVDGSYLGSRGVLLGLGLEIESRGQYWVDMSLGGVPDGGEDRGFIRIPESDREKLRLWYRAQGRYILSEKEWIELSLTVQSDAAVQSEFYESEFLRYERAENYVHWRKVIDDYYVTASAKKRLNSFRTGAEELPSARAFVGRRPLGKLGSVPIVHTGEVQADYLRRRQGEVGEQSPFEAPAPFRDGLGDREVVRVDTTQTLEGPVPLGTLGLKATPYVSLRATAWNKGVDRDDSPTRFLGEAGLRLATTFWKRTSGGLQLISPFFDLHGDFFFDEEGEPVTFDSVEEALEGKFAEVGVRTRLNLSETGGGRAVDLDVRSGYGADLPDGQPDGFLPVSILGRVDAAPFGTPLELWHDSSHDFEAGDTRYALTSVALRVGEGLRIEAGHHFGRSSGGRRLFEAASVAGLYRWTEKWEIEGRQTFSLSEDGALDTRGLLRRFGHDVIFEIEVSFREGEGTSFSFGIEPRFGWKRSGLGFLQY